MAEHGRVETIFHDARALETPAARRAFLDEACAGDATLRGEVEAYLAAEADLGDFLETVSVATDAGADADCDVPAGEGPGAVVGRYELFEKLGEGGFGDVFLARQTQPNSPRVALKIVKAGMDTRRVLARFETERRTLALMEHPNIARVFDGGATASGRPYFVMELVDGQPITTYADEHGLSVRARLELMIDVCAAVQHAHQKGVIHRDIKPSNVLVMHVDGKPVAKVIDFGIAKATTPEDGDRATLTAEGLFIGTPQYMSPEQAGLSSLDVDTRADVYSLGVLVYELLTGTTPLDPTVLRNASAGELQRLVSEAATPTPSTRLGGLDTIATVASHRRTDARGLRRQLQRDLDWVVLHALERDRTRRYQTAREFAEDLRRYLADEPVAARPPTAAYRLRTFVRRHRVAVTTVAAVAAALVLGVVGTTAGLVWALDTKTELAETNAALDRIVDFQNERLREIDPRKMGLDVRAGVLTRAREALVRSGLEADAVEGDMVRLETLLAGSDFTALARDLAERNIFEQTLAAIDREFDDQPLLQASLLQTVADSLAELGLLERAVGPQTRALEIRRARLGATHPDTLDSMSSMGTLLRKRGAYDEAATYHEPVLAERRRQFGDDDVRTLDALSALGVLAYYDDRYDDAEPLFREAMAGYERTVGPTHRKTLQIVSNLGALLEMRGRLEEAEAAYREARAGFTAALGPEHQRTLVMDYNLSNVLQALGRSAEAEASVRTARDGMLRTLGRDHPVTLGVTNGLGTVLYLQERMDEALVYLEEGMVERRRVLGDRHPETLASIASVGAVLRALERLDEADALGAESVRSARLVLPGHWILGTILVEHGRTLTAMGRYDEAEAELLEGHGLLAATYGDTHPRSRDAAVALTALYDAWHAAAPDAGHDATSRTWQARGGATE